MKIMAVTAGRHNGNCELMAKAALKVCEEEFGAEVVWTNLHDHKIIPCTGCESCITGMYTKMQRPVCVSDDKDDFRMIMNEWESADGIIICVPSYFQQEPGIFKVFSDRWLCYEWGNMKNCGIIDEVPKKIVGIMCVGGSAQSWHSMTIDQIHAQLTAQSVKVVDKYIFTRCASTGHVLMHNDKMDRVRQLGRNVALACTLPYEDVQFMAKDWKYICPACHSNLIANSYPHWDGLSFVHECAVCGAGGELKTGEDGQAVLELAPNGLEHCRAFTEGRANHILEIQSAHKAAAESAAEIQRRRREALLYQPHKI